MKVLLTNADDGTLILTKILEFEYFRDTKEITIAGEVDDFNIPNVEEEDFKAFARQLYNDGKADLTYYKAEIIE